VTHICCYIFLFNLITPTLLGFYEVAKVLTDFFHHDGFLDLSPLDVLSGLLLVRLYQKRKRILNSKRQRHNLKHDNVNDIDNVNNDDKSDDIKNNNNDDDDDDILDLHHVSIKCLHDSTKNNIIIDDNNTNSDLSLNKIYDDDDPFDTTYMNTFNYKNNINSSATGSNNNIINIINNNNNRNIAIDMDFDYLSDSSSNNTTVTKEELAMLTRCSTYCLSIYTHLIYIYMYPITGNHCMIIMI
jgi:hypothetical protein